MDKNRIPKQLIMGCPIFSRVLRDFTPRLVGPSVRRSVRPSHFYFFGNYGVFGLTARA